MPTLFTPLRSSLARALLGVLTVFACASIATPATGPNCAAGHHHDFDFWAGAWSVSNPAGKVVGTNRIDVLADGCVLQEHWLGNGNVSGTSLNYFDRDDGKWHQIWVDNQGGVLNLAGGLVQADMVLEGESVATAQAKSKKQRITWSRRPDGSVRQLWESSDDGGHSWSVAFDGLYTKSIQ